MGKVFTEGDRLHHLLLHLVHHIVHVLKWIASILEKRIVIKAKALKNQRFISLTAVLEDRVHVFLHHLVKLVGPLHHLPHHVLMSQQSLVVREA